MERVSLPMPPGARVMCDDLLRALLALANIAAWALIAAWVVG
jgi:hypothetical protein